MCHNQTMLSFLHGCEGIHLKGTFMQRFPGREHKNDTIKNEEFANLWAGLQPELFIISEQRSFIHLFILQVCWFNLKTHMYGNASRHKKWWTSKVRVVQGLKVQLYLLISPPVEGLSLMGDLTLFDFIKFKRNHRIITSWPISESLGKRLSNSVLTVLNKSQISKANSFCGNSVTRWNGPDGLSKKIPLNNESELHLHLKGQMRLIQP